MEIRAKISLAIDQFKANASTVGSVFSAMTRDAQQYAQGVDKLIEKNLVNRLDASQKGKVADMRNLEEFEKKMITSNRRMQKEAMEAQFRNRGGMTRDDSSTRASMPVPNISNEIASRRAAEKEYSSWWEKEISLREQKLYWESGKGRKALLDEHKGMLKEREGEEKRYSQWLKQNTSGQVKEKEKLAKQSIKEAADYEKRLVEAGVESYKKAAKERQVAELDAAKAARKEKSKLDFQEMKIAVNSKEFESAMPRIRYALYDVARQAAVVTATITGMGYALINVSKEFESSFTSVERTSGAVGGELTRLRKDLVQLTREIPVAFQDVTKIATLGAQMGIAAEDLKEFTQTVARFSAITGITVEQTAQSFGRLAELMNVPVDQFENLSSAIVFAGINAVATDKEIVVMAESIAAASTQAGIGAQGVIGLATALSSLKVRPEEARGAILRLFRVIDLEAAKGGARFDDFAKVLNKTSAEAKALWKQNPQEFFTSMLKAAGASGKLNEVITALGITNSRELNVIQRLANNTDVLTSSMKDAEEQFLLGSFSAEAYGMVADDLNSKITILNNNIQAIMDQIGTPLADALKPVLDFINGFLGNIKFIPPALIFVVAGIATVVAAFAGMIMTKALLIGGLLAIKTALVGLGGQFAGMGLNLKTVKALLASLNIEFGKTGILAKTTTAATGALSAGFQRLGLSAAAASGAVKALNVTLGIFGIAVLAGYFIFETFNAIVREQTEAIEESGRATLEAAGGADALSAAIFKDTIALAESQKAGSKTAKVYGNLTTKITKAAEKTKDITAVQVGAAKSFENLKKSVLETDSAIASSSVSYDQNRKAIEERQEATRIANQETKESIALIEGETLALGDNTLEFLLNAMRKYAGEDGVVKDFVLQQVGDPAVMEVAKAFGFNFIGVADAAMADAAGDGMGARNYIQSIEDDYTKFLTSFSSKIGRSITVADDQEAINKKVADAVRQTGEEFKWSEDKINSVTKSLQGYDAKQLKTGSILKAFPQYYDDLALSQDSTLIVQQNIISSNDEWAASTAGVINNVEEEQEAIDALNDQLERYINNTKNIPLANNAVIDSFENFVAGIEESDGSIEGFTKSARKNMSNWSSLMDSSFKAAKESAEGTEGFVRRLATALIVLNENGMDTSGQFEGLRDVMLEAYSGLGDEYDGLLDALATAPNLAGLREAVYQLYLTALAADHTGAAAIKLKGILDALDGDDTTAFGDAFAAALEKITKGAGSAKSAFDKLKDAIKEAFDVLRKNMNVTSSVNALGAAIAENGAAFDRFSSGGQANINALLSTIDSLVERFGKDPKMLAGQLLSLRQALINTGNSSPRALGLIKKALDAVGVSGKKSRASVKEFANELRKMTSEQSRVIGLANAMKGLSDSVMQYLDARWMLGNAQMEIAAGWESIAEETNKAKTEIEDISDEIAGFAADRGILEYQLSIALKYGDTLRANELRAQIAELNQQEADLIAQNQQQIAEASQGSATPAADLLAQQQALQNIVGLYIQEGSAALIGVKTKKEARGIIKETVEKFKEQARAAGISEDNVKKYAKELRIGLRLARDLNLPVKYKVNAATKKALDQIRSFSSQATALINAIPRNIPITVTTTRVTAAATGGFIYASRGGKISGPGSGTSDSIPAMLSNGEFVMRAAAVQSYGADFMNSLNNMTLRPGSVPSVSTGAAQSSGVVYLSPEDRSLLRAAIDRPINLYTDNAKIAQSANSGNVLLAQRGLN